MTNAEIYDAEIATRSAMNAMAPGPARDEAFAAWLVARKAASAARASSPEVVAALAADAARAANPAPVSAATARYYDLDAPSHGMDCDCGANACDGS